MDTPKTWLLPRDHRKIPSSLFKSVILPYQERSITPSTLIPQLLPYCEKCSGPSSVPVGPISLPSPQDRLALTEAFFWGHPIKGPRKAFHLLQFPGVAWPCILCSSTLDATGSSHLDCQGSSHYSNSNDHEYDRADRDISSSPRWWTSNVPHDDNW